ncbi:MAG: transposase [Paracoccaceae bacterium]|nr:transposase [Paracoccaceae bacterium]
MFRHSFETVLRRWMDEGLVGGRSFGVDASLIPANAGQTRGIDSQNGLPENPSSRVVNEYLETLDDAAFDASTKLAPKYIPPVDPAARWSGADNGAAFFAYSTNYMVDLDNAVIVDVEPSVPIRTAEAFAVRRMIDRITERFDMTPGKLVGNTGYGSAEMLGWLVEERGIAPHIPVWDKSKRTDGTFSREDFVYDLATDSYTCPGGKALQTYRRNVSTPRKANGGKDGFIRYRASKHDCDICPLKPQCYPKNHGRRLMRSVHEAARDVARDIGKTDAYMTSSIQRRKVETLFAHLKRYIGVATMRLRGPRGAYEQFQLAAAPQNLRKLAKLVPQTEPTRRRDVSPQVSTAVKPAKTPNSSTLSGQTCLSSAQMLERVYKSLSLCSKSITWSKIVTVRTSFSNGCSRDGRRAVLLSKTNERIRSGQHVAKHP